MTLHDAAFQFQTMPGAQTPAQLASADKRHELSLRLTIARSNLEKAHSDEKQALLAKRRWIQQADAAVSAGDQMAAGDYQRQVIAAQLQEDELAAMTRKAQGDLDGLLLAAGIAPAPIAAVPAQAEPEPAPTVADQDDGGELPFFVKRSGHHTAIQFVDKFGMFNEGRILQVSPPNFGDIVWRLWQKCQALEAEVAVLKSEKVARS